MHTVPANSFVVLSDFIPDILLDIRYHSTYNFVGTRIDGYDEPIAILSLAASKALKAVNADLLALGYRLKIYDCYRPQRAVNHFVRWAEDINDTRMKPVFYPDVDKASLFTDGYIARRSGHSRGSTVDLTLVNEGTGKDLDMGGTFDYFGELSHPTYTATLTTSQISNRMLLRKFMLRHGFKPLSSEWWHFTLIDEPFPDTYFDFPVRASSV